jgi:RNA polymerase sigma-70 factor (TIGR02960 family)
VIQLLPPQQRAVLILRDVLEWSAAETAALLDTTVAAANSALQRARATLRAQLPERPVAADELTDDERALLQGFIETHERGDIAAAAAMLRDDVRVTMPPNPGLYEGREAIVGLMRLAFDTDAMGEWRLVPTRANRMPAAASYQRAPGDTVFRAFKLDVLRVEDGAIAEITTFNADLFEAFGLARTL